MGKVVTAEARRFMVDCLRAVGAGAKPAIQQAELMIQADKLGHPSHGLHSLELYVNDIVAGVCCPNNEPRLLKESSVTAWVDANSVLGATSSQFCMEIATSKALQSGIGWVSVKGSNHDGMMGVWAKKAADEGLIGMACTNTTPVGALARPKKPELGANSIAIAAPANNDDIFYLDLDTTMVSMGKTELKRQKKEPLLPIWAQGPDGKDAIDAEMAARTASLMPLGDGEMAAEYKGFALAALVEIFSGLLAGSSYAHHFRPWGFTASKPPTNLGHCFVALNPDCFAPCFRYRMYDCLQHWRTLNSADKKKPVSTSGEKEMQEGCETNAKGTVFYVKDQLAASDVLARKLKVKPMQVVYSY